MNHSLVWRFALTCLVITLPRPAEGATLTRAPYLQLLTLTSVTIMWKTEEKENCGLFIRPGDGGDIRIIDGPHAKACAIEVTDLVPGTQYLYMPLANRIPLESESMFRTDAPGMPYTFLVVGDTGTGKEEQYAIADRMVESAPDFIVHTGDMVYDAASDTWDPQHFDVYAGLLRSTMMWPCLGNHDDADGGASWRRVLQTPANNIAGDEFYYSFHQGNALFVVLNTEVSSSMLGPGGEQHLFADEVLGASDADWKFVVLHRPLYSSGRHGSSNGLREKIAPLIDRHAVDIVFTGHDHDYERTIPLMDRDPAPAGAGTVYIVTGGGGASPRPVGSSWYTAYSEETLHFVRVMVDGGFLQLEMVRDDGSIGDMMILEKVIAQTTTTSVTTTSSTSSTTTTTSSTTTTSVRPTTSTTTTVTPTTTTLPGVTTTTPTTSTSTTVATSATTSSSMAATTTTTLSVALPGDGDPGCVAQLDGFRCDDGDACSVDDRCFQGVCTGVFSGVGSFACSLGRLGEPELCATYLPKRLARQIRRKRSRALRAALRMERLSGRGAAEKKVRRQMGKVERSIHAIGRLARRAASAARNRDRISHTCAATIETLSRIPMRALEGLGLDAWNTGGPGP